MVDSLKKNSVKTPEFFSDGCGQANEFTPLILIVDDDEDSRLMLKTLFKLWKYEVLEATDGGEAIRIADEAHPDLIVMDVKMPHLDGFEVTRKLRQLPFIKEVPIVFISGCAEAMFKQKASAVGGNEYLVKPVNFEELEITLCKYVSRVPVF